MPTAPIHVGANIGYGHNKNYLAACLITSGELHDAHTIPVSISPEANNYVAQLGMQEPFQRILDHALETIRGLREIRVTWQPAYDVGAPCVLIEALKDDPQVPDDPTQREWGRWRVTTFPPEIFQHMQSMAIPRDER